MKILSRLLAPVVLVASLCLLIPDQVQAAGRGGFGGFRSGFGGYRGGFERGYGYRGWGYRGWGYGGWGLGLGYGLGYGGYPYSGYGSTLGGYAYDPSYSNYSTPQAYTSPSYSTTPNVVSVGPDVTTTQSAYYNPSQPTPATVEVRVPADAKVWFEDTLTTKTGNDRVFTTPPLVTGKTFYYEVKAQWMKDGKPVEKTQLVQVSGGLRSLANFITP